MNLLLYYTLLRISVLFLKISLNSLIKSIISTRIIINNSPNLLYNTIFLKKCNSIREEILK